MGRCPLGQTRWRNSLPSTVDTTSHFDPHDDTHVNRRTCRNGEGRPSASGNPSMWLMCISVTSGLRMASAYRRAPPHIHIVPVGKLTCHILKPIRFCQTEGVGNWLSLPAIIAAVNRHDGSPIWIEVDMEPHILPSGFTTNQHPARRLASEDGAVFGAVPPGCLL